MYLFKVPHDLYSMTYFDWRPSTRSRLLGLFLPAMFHLSSTDVSFAFARKGTLSAHDTDTCSHSTLLVFGASDWHTFFIVRNSSSVSWAFCLNFNQPACASKTHVYLCSQQVFVIRSQRMLYSPEVCRRALKTVSFDRFSAVMSLSRHHSAPLTWLLLLPYSKNTHTEDEFKYQQASKQALSNCNALLQRRRTFI